MSEHHTKYAAQHRRQLVERVNAGDADAGRAMLMHAMAALWRAIPADESDRVALEWLREALRLITVEGYPCDRALGVERMAGRPKRSKLRDVMEAAWIAPEVLALAEQFRAEGVPAPKRKAVQRVAQRMKVSESRLRQLLALVAPKSL